MATALNAVEAHAWRLALEEAGVTCKVVGDYLDAGIGDIPGARVELWVPHDQVGKAQAVLADQFPHPSSYEEVAQ